MKIIGIDPGIKGGLSFFDNDKLLSAIATPTKEYSMGSGKQKKIKKTVDEHCVGKLIVDFKPNVIYIEKVGAMPNQGSVSMFNFGYVYGIMFGVAGAINCEINTVRPQIWKGVILKETEKDKDAAIEFCKYNFSDISLRATKRSRTDHDGIADAICIGTYGIYEEVNKRITIKERK